MDSAENGGTTPGKFFHVALRPGRNMPCNGQWKDSKVNYVHTREETISHTVQFVGAKDQSHCIARGERKKRKENERERQP